jgi:ribonucleoside-diphosphate reductase alpha chain
MCPDTFKGLSDVYGYDFEVLYERYETQVLNGEISPGPYKVIKARDLWYKILDTIMETGTPYITFKDSVNNKTNQKNIGIIRSSNLCTEIMQYSDKDQTAVCNLASIALPTFVDETTKEFDYDKLHYVSKVLTQNLNNIIDINFYPTEKSKISNFAHRPIGIGVQGLADAFIKMDVAFHSSEALEINKKIFETIYHGALERSNELAKLNGSYDTFVGSPASEGILQFDMWCVEPSNERYDWTSIKNDIVQFGLRNSLLLAPMPTASTSQILGFNECFEPFTSNIYSRGTHAGEFVITNKYLIKELLDMGVWNETIKNSIIQNKGSIQHLTFLDKHILQKYKIVWEIPMKHIIEMSADRGAYICQSQSLNLWVEDPNYKILTSMLFYSWKKGLKTGMYYLRRKAKHTAQQFTIEPPSCTTCSA